MDAPRHSSDTPGSAADDPRVCYCMQVQRDTIIEAIRDGAHTVAAIGAVTGAGTGCRTCRIDLLALLAEHAPSTRPPDDLD